MALATYTDHNWTCFPSVSRLVTDCEISRRSVFNQLKKLVEMGLIFLVKKGAGRTSNTYRLAFSSAHDAPLASRSGEPGAPLKVNGKSVVVHGVHHSSAPDDTVVVHGVHPNYNINNNITTGMASQRSVGAGAACQPVRRAPPNATQVTENGYVIGNTFHRWEGDQ